MKITIINHSRAEVLTRFGNRFFTEAQLDEIRSVK